jgi:hypothetical protein
MKARLTAHQTRAPHTILNANQDRLLCRATGHANGTGQFGTSSCAPWEEIWNEERRLGTNGEYSRELLSVCYLTLSLPPIVFRLNPSSASPKKGNPGSFILGSPSSPKRNAAFSRPGPDVGFLPVFKNGDDALGGDDLIEELEGVSGSSIQLKELHTHLARGSIAGVSVNNVVPPQMHWMQASGAIGGRLCWGNTYDWAMVDRVGTGALGLVNNSGADAGFVSSKGFCNVCDEALSSLAFTFGDVRFSVLDSGLGAKFGGVGISSIGFFCGVEIGDREISGFNSGWCCSSGGGSIASSEGLDGSVSGESGGRGMVASSR